jgi:hypothetical protein
VLGLNSISKEEAMCLKIDFGLSTRPSQLGGLVMLIVLACLILAGCCCKDREKGEHNPVGFQDPTGSEEPPDPYPVIVVPDDVETIQQAIDSLPPEGGTVHVRAGTYILSQGIHVNRSKVTISGEQGVVVKLGEHVNQPVFLIGTDEEIPTASTENIRISEIEIDGNKGHQDSEDDAARPWIKNNGIDVRMVHDLWIDNVDVHDARSGGIVVSCKSRRIFINNSSFHHNFWDGIGLYDSEDIQISNFFCYDDGAAGLSMDLKLKCVSFSNGSLKGNGDVGVFVRDSEDLSFHNLLICGSGSHGSFLSHQEDAIDTGVKRLFFSGCSFFDNNGYGLWLASPSSESPDNAVVGCLFSGNTLGPIEIHPEGELYQEANIFLPFSGVFRPSF